MRGHIGDERPVETGRQLGRKVARLIGVRQHHDRRRELRNRRLQRRGVAVGCVGLERGASSDDRLRARRRRRARPRRRPSIAGAPGRMTVIGSAPAICCAAAIVSQVARFNFPPRCSAITRIMTRLPYRNDPRVVSQRSHQFGWRPRPASPE